MAWGDKGRILDENKDEIIQKYLAGASTPKLGKEYKCSNALVFLRLRDWGVPLRDVKIGVYHEEDILRLHKGGKATYEIMSELGITEIVVRRMLKRHGLSPNYKIEYHQEGLRQYTDDIIADYASGIGVTRLGKKYGVPEGSILHLLEKNGVEIRPYHRCPVNQEFFDIIDNEDKAYVLGFWMADGSNNPKVGTTRLSITDQQILEDIAKVMGFRGKIRKTQRGNYLPQYQINIGSRKISDALTRLGCVRGKTYTAQFQSEDQCPRHLQRHLIRGWMDGDGTITGGKREEPGKHQSWYSRIIGTQAVCDGIADAVYDHLGFWMKVSPVHIGRKHTTWGCTVTARNLKCYLDWLYDGATIYLERKRDRYLEFVRSL